MEVQEKREHHVPWLLFYHGDRFRKQSFVDIVPYSSSSQQGGHCNYGRYMTTSRLKGKTVEACSHGWLVLLSKSESNSQLLYSLCNSVTFESIELPPVQLKVKQRINTCLLSAPPRHPDSMLILFEKTTPSLFIYQLGLGDHRYCWTEIPYSEELKRVIGNGEADDFLSRAVMVNEKLYGITQMDGLMLHIELAKAKEEAPREYDVRITSIESLQVPHPRLSFSNYVARHYAESGGELFSICINLGGLLAAEAIEVQIWKLNFSTEHMMWEKVETIHDKQFFLSSYAYAISCTTTQSGREGGFIYFVREDDNRLYSYKVNDRSLSLTLPCPNLPTPWKTPVWVIGYKFNEPHKNRNKNYEIARETLISNCDELKTTASEVKVGGQVSLLDLPCDILQAIADRLDVFDYLNFRATCNHFRSIATPISWRSTLSEGGRIKNRSLSPMLMLPRGDKGISTFIDPKFGNRYLISMPKEFGDATVCSSMCGWLLIRTTANGYSSMIFYNPFTKATIPLADLPADMGCFAINGFGFSNPPTSSTTACSIVGIAPNFGSAVTIYITTVESENWTSHDFSNNLPFEPNHNSPIQFDEVYVFLGQKGNLAILQYDEDTEEFGWTVLKKPHPPCNSFHQNYLLKCGGDLLSVFVGKSGKWVKVFRLMSDESDDGYPNWEEVENLGNYMLYVSGATSFAVEATQLGMENKIYFPRLYEEDVLFYSLDTCKFHTFGSNDCSLPNYYNTHEQLLCGWIEPTFSTSNLIA